MILYLVRHGHAEDDYRVDAHRPLTGEGRARMRRTARAWAKHKDSPAPDLWLVSPLVRAVQTCEICVDAFGADGPTEVTPDLVPEARVSNAAALFDRADAEAIAVVSHEPLMSSLASHLLDVAFTDFKKGMIVAMERKKPGDTATLRWILEPAKDDRDPRFRQSL